MRKKRVIDWVTTNQTYNFDVAPVTIPDGAFDVLRMTQRRDIESQASAQFFENSYTVIRVIGKIWCWILPFTNWWETITGRTFFTFRITKGLQVQDTSSPIYNIIDMSTGSGGQDEFMWQDTQYFIAQSAWGDITVDPSNYVREIPVDITVRRRLDPGEALLLAVQYGPGLDYASGIEPFPDGAYDAQLRVLLEQK